MPLWITQDKLIQAVLETKGDPVKLHAVGRQMRRQKLLTGTVVCVAVAALAAGFIRFLVQDVNW